MKDEVKKEITIECLIQLEEFSTLHKYVKKHSINEMKRKQPNVGYYQAFDFQKQK